MVSCSTDAAFRWKVACQGVSGLVRGDGNAVGDRRALTVSSSTTVTRTSSFSLRSGESLTVGDDEIESMLLFSAVFGVRGDAEVGERSDFREKRNPENRVLTASGLFIVKLIYERKRDSGARKCFRWNRRFWLVENLFVEGFDGGRFKRPAQHAKQQTKINMASNETN